MNFNKEQQEELFLILKKRFEKNPLRHKGIVWQEVQDKLTKNPQAYKALYAMESTGGEPDVVAFDAHTKEYIFFDCATESPKGRRSICYDKEALDARKEFKPNGSAIDMALEMGIEILDEEQYHFLQKLGDFDLKTSSWLKTPNEIRKLGGAIFGDFRYNHVFIYHNGAQSYYAARGFRGCLKV